MLLVAPEDADRLRKILARPPVPQPAIVDPPAEPAELFKSKRPWLWRVAVMLVVGSIVVCGWAIWYASDAHVWHSSAVWRAGSFSPNPIAQPLRQPALRMRAAAGFG